MNPDSPREGIETLVSAALLLAAYRDGRIDDAALDSGLNHLALMDSVSIVLDPLKCSTTAAPVVAENLLDDLVKAFALEGYSCIDENGVELPNLHDDEMTCDKCGECVHVHIKNNGNCLHCNTAQIGCACPESYEVIE